jgi:hypothetical protein
MLTLINQDKRLCQAADKLSSCGDDESVDARRLTPHATQRKRGSIDKEGSLFERWKDRSWVGAGPNGLAVTLFDDKLNKEGHRESDDDMIIRGRSLTPCVTIPARWKPAYYWRPFSVGAPAAEVAGLVNRSSRWKPRRLWALGDNEMTWPAV